MCIVINPKLLHKKKKKWKTLKRFAHLTVIIHLKQNSQRVLILQWWLIETWITIKLEDLTIS